MSPNEIRDLRRGLGLSQAAFGAVVLGGGSVMRDASRQVTVARWESGASRPCEAAEKVLQRLLAGEVPPVVALARSWPAARIFELRQWLGVNQMEFGVLVLGPSAKAPQPTVARWESGEKAPHGRGVFEAMERLASS